MTVKPAFPKRSQHCCNAKKLLDERFEHPLEWHALIFIRACAPVTKVGDHSAKVDQPNTYPEPSGCEYQISYHADAVGQESIQFTVYSVQGTGEQACTSDPITLLGI